MQRSRHQQIVALLLEHGECSVEELSRRCKVSDMTIRRDLAGLAESGKVIRTHGGAVVAGQVSFEFQFLHRVREREEAKDQIGALAAGLVKDGQTVMLDSGTTTLAVSRHLRARQGLTVITTSLPIAANLQHAPGVDLLLLGGLVRRSSPDLAGPLTMANLEMLAADIAFIGADGIDFEGRVYNQSLEVGRMLARMAASAANVFAVADSSKIGRRALMRFADLRRWQGLITDADLPAAHAAALRKAGLNLMICPRKKENAQ